ncbi:BlaI/MecI/CopY family transcriptional regulator [Flavobacterium agricola]|uniref:BlaI/MecI/CopY family transcriptional regulator n=1 Tax=Flavobacterium agricola TaxID=2870839 RepID=A0ABY6M1H5_9FLAO|nr:BlaI/MecI/CopY family transcriptional regulator [Flavobacterium agricola]UYW02403.1 BlaI/MecI/CopY family transcriptional regulator [Flavobacterium agricola]
MEKLTNKEEEIMHIIWQIQKGFINDILEEMPEPKPHYNTLSTIVRLLEDKGFLAHKSYGKSHQYYPIITLDKYRSKYVDESLKKYFSNSVSNLISHFVKDEKLSENEIQEILEIILKNRAK